MKKRKGEILKIDRKLIKALKKIMEKFEFEIDDNIVYVKKVIEKFEKENDTITLTENGALILDFLKLNSEYPLSAREIAAQIGYTSKSVAGSMRKLIGDGLVIKISSNDGNKYQITEDGKKLEIKNQEEK
ncbi:MAG: hypothetical protein KQ78_01921 [Candidatus Izimaplasma bacterium HR2]|nr:MAG: hypothetical protein KQ78_01921 [Candidatus Izimaplasma bacterium HR2]